MEALAGISLDANVVVLSIFSVVGVIGASLALGIRHGIDWDHIAAITDITSTTATLEQTDEGWLVHEPGLLLTDESHHTLVHTEMDPLSAGAHVHGPALATASAASLTGRRGTSVYPAGGGAIPVPSRNGHLATVDAFVRTQRPSLLLGTMYALGHGSVVFVLGALAILAKNIFPDWIDPVLERVVGVTLLFLAAYLFYSVFRFFRGGEELRLRSRWMLVFAGVRNGFEIVRSRIIGRPRRHVHEARQYGVRTAYGIGMIHGLGAETGTQVLVITTAVGAGSRFMGVVALAAFIAGLLVSNSIVTIVTTVGFVSTRQRQWIYASAGLLAAAFGLVIGLFFVFQAGGELPDLGQYFRWIGGPD